MVEDERERRVIEFDWCFYIEKRVSLLCVLGREREREMCGLELIL